MITLHSPLDMHLHLRQDAMLRLVAPLTARSFAAAGGAVAAVDALEALAAGT